ASPSTRAARSRRRSRRCSAPTPSSSSMPDALEFEKKLIELENELAELRADANSPRMRERIARKEEELAREQLKTHAALTPWQRTQVARHPKRPHLRDLCKLLFTDFVELHGDRLFGDDPAIVGGLARFEDRS